MVTMADSGDGGQEQTGTMNKEEHAVVEMAEENKVEDVRESAVAATTKPEYVTPQPEKKKKKSKGKFETWFKTWFDKHYMKTLAVPIILFLIACFSFGYHYKTTGDWFDRGIEFGGGTIVTLDWNPAWGSVQNPRALEQELSTNLGIEVSVQELREYTGGATMALVVESGSEFNSSQLTGAVTEAVEKTLPSGATIMEEDYSVRYVKPALGSAFFSSAMKQIAIAFVLLGIVVFFVFKSPMVSVITLSCAFLNLFEAFALINILGLKLSSGTFTALLGIIAYSVDDNVLIATKLLKNKNKKPIDNAYEGVKTSAMIATAFIVALLVLYLMSSVPIIRDIAFVLMFGEIVDLLNTWFQNLPLLMWYVKDKEKKARAH